MTALRSVGHIALLIRDFKRLGSFYADVFEAEVVERSARDAQLGLGFIRVGNATVLHVFERPADALAGRRPIGIRRSRRSRSLRVAGAEVL